MGTALSLSLSLSCAEDTPEMYELEVLKVGGITRRIVLELATDWKTIAYALRFKDYLVKNMEDRSKEEACRETLRRWLDGEGGAPPTWEALIEVLEDIDRATLAEDLKKLLIQP